MRRLCERSELVELARELAVRPDWHEPDEQYVTARVEGVSFDNAGFWPTESRPFAAPEAIEMHVVIAQHGEDVAAVNLATLFAWASQPDPFEEVNEVLRSAGIEHPSGVNGVRDLATQRDGEYAARREVEDELLRCRQAGGDRETELVGSERAERLWRNQLSSELRAYAQEVESGAAGSRTVGSRAVASALGAMIAGVIGDCADRIGGVT